MNKKVKLLSVLAVSTLMSLASCGNTGSSSSTTASSSESSSSSSSSRDTSYASGTVLRIAAGYNSAETGITMASTIAGDGIELADGKTYRAGDLKPTWAHLQDKLGVTFENDYKGSSSAAAEFQAWDNSNSLDKVDIIAGSSAALVAAGSQGKLIDFNKYLDQMPNFKAYLEENPIARLSITGSTSGDSKGAIYFSPYFDGVNDIERMPLIRADMVTKLLDGTNAYSGDNRKIETKKYTPYMPTTGTVEIDIVNADGTTGKLTKDYSKYGNIIDKMNSANGLTGDSAVAMLRDYIDKTYGGHYGEKRSDLFLGQDAAWDADELVALFRCVHASLSDDTTEQNAVVPLFSRETSNLNRDYDLVRFAGHLFGVRGLESRQDYLYFDKDGTLHDARQESDSFAAVEKMYAMAQEGLIAISGTSTSADYLLNDAGLMSYDYNQTQTIYNDTKLNGKGTDTEDTGEKYLAVSVPVAKWDDGTGAKYKRFTESWRSVKTDGWGISAAGVEGNKDKLNAALKLFDFAFSVQGQITMSYGPDTFISVKDASVEVNTWADVAKKYNTFNFNGTEMPVIKDETYAELTSKAKGNYTNYARKYLGSTLNGFPKSQAFEYQCTNAVGKEGAAILSAEIGAGVLDHPLLSVNTANMWYTSVPTTLPTTSSQTQILSGLTDLSGSFSQTKGENNVFFNILKGGVTGLDAFVYSTADAAASYVTSSMEGNKYLTIKSNQWKQLLNYYQGN